MAWTLRDYDNPTFVYLPHCQDKISEIAKYYKFPEAKFLISPIMIQQSNGVTRLGFHSLAREEDIRLVLRTMRRNLNNQSVDQIIEALRSGKNISLKPTHDGIGIRFHRKHFSKAEDYQAMTWRQWQD